MKKLIVILFLFIPVLGYSQDNKNKKEEDVTISINVSKIDRTLGSIIGFIKSEAKQFKQETVENLDPETKAGLDSLKNNIFYELKYTRDAIHAGWVQGLRGEEYTPPYKHK